MAVINWTTEAANIRGRMNNTTFQTTRAGRVAEKTRWLVNHRDEAQQKQRQRFRWIASNWRLLTQQQRAAWNTNPPDGIDGFHWFMSVNIQGGDFQQPIQKVPIPPVYPITIDTYSFEWEWLSVPQVYVASGEFTCTPDIQNGQGYSLTAWIQVCTTNSCPANFNIASDISPDYDFGSTEKTFSFDTGFYAGQPPLEPGNKCWLWLQIYMGNTQESQRVLMSTIIPQQQ